MTISRRAFIKAMARNSAVAAAAAVLPLVDDLDEVPALTIMEADGLAPVAAQAGAKGDDPPRGRPDRRRQSG